MSACIFSRGGQKFVLHHECALLALEKHMNLNAAGPRLTRGLDWAFIAGAVFALVLAGKIVPFLVLVGVLPIPFLLPLLRQRRYLVSPARLLVPAAIYFTYVLLTYFFYTGLQPGDAKPVNPDLELYGIGIVMLLVGMIRSLEVDDLKRKFDMVVPWTLVAAFLVLSVLMFAAIAMHAGSARRPPGRSFRPSCSER